MTVDGEDFIPVAAVAREHGDAYTSSRVPQPYGLVLGRRQQQAFVDSVEAAIIYGVAVAY